MGFVRSLLFESLKADSDLLEPEVRLVHLKLGRIAGIRSTNALPITCFIFSRSAGKFVCGFAIASPRVRPVRARRQHRHVAR